MSGTPLGLSGVSRRAVLAGASAGLAGLLGAGLAACGGDDDKQDTTGGAATSASATQTAEPPRGGAVRAAQTADLVLTTGFPFVSAAGLTRVQFASMEPLVQYDRQFKLQPVLAERFEFNTDRTKATFTLKPGVQFSNGAPVTPEDVFFGIELALDPKKFGATGASHLRPFAVMITEMRKVDARTLEFTFDKKRVNITDLFTQLLVTHRDSYPELVQGKKIVGTGPYVFKDWTPGQGYTLEANANWHAAGPEGKPGLDAIVARVFADDGAAALAFESDDIQLYEIVSAASAARFRKDGMLRLRPKGGMEYLAFNVTNPVLQDKRVRQAIYYAVDRKRMVSDVGEGIFQVTAQPWAETSPAYDPALDAPFYEPDRSKRLLREAGFTQAQPLELEFPSTGNPPGYAQVLQQNFNDIGMKVNLKPLEYSAWLRRLLNGEFPDLFLGTHTGADAAPITMFQRIFAYRLPDNPSHFTAPEYAQLIREMEEVDPGGEEAKRIYRKVNEFFREDPHLVPVGMPNVNTDLVSKKLYGWPASAAEYPVGGFNYAALRLKR